MDVIKKYYVLNVKGFEATKMCACTIAFEGNKHEVEAQEKNVYKVA